MNWRFCDQRFKSYHYNVTLFYSFRTKGNEDMCYNTDADVKRGYPESQKCYDEICDGLIDESPSVCHDSFYDKDF